MSQLIKMEQFPELHPHFKHINLKQGDFKTLVGKSLDHWGEGEGGGRVE